MRNAQDGDEIQLEGGDYGDVRLTAANRRFVTVAAGAGQRPVLSSLTLSGRYWLVRGLTIDGASGGAQPASATPAGKWPAHPWLVKVYGGSDIIITGNTITSQTGAYPWRPEATGMDDPVPLWNGVTVENGSCVTLANNQISNVFNGVFIGGDQQGDNGRHFHVIGNHIDNFAGDGIDHAVSDALIAGNVITNSHDLCQNICIHTDGIQGWNFNNRPGMVNTDVIIEGNTILQRTVADLPMPGDALQGITIFDGFWKHVEVLNNIVVVDAFHGVTIGGVDGLVVANNTVLGNSPRRTWILAGETTHQGGVSRNVVVRDNIATAMSQPKMAVSNMKVDHNLITGDPAALFIAFDPARGVYDLRPRERSAAVGRGADANGAQGAP